VAVIYPSQLIFQSSTHPDQIGVNDSPANSPAYEHVAGAEGRANFYVAQTSTNAYGLSIYNHALQTNRDYAGGDTVRSHRIALLVQTDVDNNDPTIPSKVDIYGWNICSVINAGKNGPNYGSSLAYSALVDVFNETAGNEYSLYHGCLVPGTYELHVAAGANYWTTDLSVYGPIGVQPGLLYGFSMGVANFYNGSPSAGASFGCRIMNAMDGPGAAYKRHAGKVLTGTMATCYPIDIGVGVGGATNGGTGDSFTVGVQVGGAEIVSPYNSATLSGDQGQIGRGVVVKAKNAGTSCARLGAYVSEGTGEAGGLVFGLDTNDANRVSIYRSSNSTATLNGNLVITGSISAASGLGSGGATSPGGTSGQIEYNNAGAFGGFTVGGDGTLNTATGVLTITKTSNVSFAASATTDTTNAANITSGTLPLGRLTVFVASGASHAAGIVPDPGVTSGTTKFLREDATWQVPAGGGGSPGGTNGQIEFNSSGAFGGFTMGGDATLNTSTGVLTVANGAITSAKQANMSALTLRGNPTGSSATPGEVTLGPGLMFNGTTLRSRMPLAWIIAPGTAIANTTTLTSIFTGATIGGSLTIPANTLQVGSMLRFELFGTFSATASVVFTAKILLGGSVILTGAQALTAATFTGNLWHSYPAAGPGLQVQVIGSSGKIIGGQLFALTGDANCTTNSTGASNAAPTQVTINTTVSLAIDIQFQWGTASTSNTIQLLGGAVYLDG
jgi:hypothetical protein